MLACCYSTCQAPYAFEWRSKFQIWCFFFLGGVQGKRGLLIFVDIEIIFLVYFCIFLVYFSIRSRGERRCPFESLYDIHVVITQLVVLHLVGIMFYTNRSNVTVPYVCVLFPLEKSLHFISVWSILFSLNVLKEG